MNFENLCMSKTFFKEINRMLCFVMFLSEDKIPDTGWKAGGAK